MWGFVVLYTLLVPNAIYVYRFIEARFGLTFAGRIPLVVVSLLGIGYVVYLWRSKLSWKKALYLIPCAAIALAIFKLEGNPNKHIHIPEYILMAWLVYAALKKDYRGGGMLILVFILASMLGVVDELEQGIHPGRSYGWTDMLVNTSSALMGVFTILGLTNYQTGKWDWATQLKRYKAQLSLIAVGGITAVVMCVRLFDVQTQGGDFQTTYPVWLLVVNYLFLIIAGVVQYIFAGKKQGAISTNLPENEAVTAKFWVYPAFYILTYMHALIVFVSLTGIAFK